MTLTLVILDGFGLNDDPARNALLAADMPNWRRLVATWPTSRLEAAGEAVGLPAGQMGNSEVGHLNLGAGFRVLQDLPRINQAIADATFRRNAALRAACGAALERGTRLHLMGLVGPGGVHAIDEHIVATAALAAELDLPADRVLLHAFTDGRDTAPRSAVAILPALLARLERTATLATVTGRYYAMDRDA
ncbi:MAG: 2,3-bisphosphoglycerate-independent phosphoglycerate mutase, partial [Candidatus Limnocylindria bacterium]